MQENTQSAPRSCSPCSRSTDEAIVTYWRTGQVWTCKAQRVGYEPTVLAFATLNEVDAFCDAYLAPGGSFALALDAAHAVAVLERRAEAYRAQVAS